MANGTLYTFPDNFRAYKALIAAQYSGAHVRVANQPPEFIYGETNKSADFLKKFPLGKVPAYENSEGVHLFESNAIASFLANDALRGSNAKDAALVHQWMEFADGEILPAAFTWVFPCMGLTPYNKQATDRAKDDIKLALNALNCHLTTRTFLVGERISLADIAVASDLLLLYQWVLDPEFRLPYQNVNRWFVTAVNQPEFKNVIGDFKLCEKMSQFDGKKYDELQRLKTKGGKSDRTRTTSSSKKDKKEEKKEKKEKKEDKKDEGKKHEVKESPPAAAAAAENEEDEEMDEGTEAPSKDPFAHLPKGTFNVDDFKRVYSNNDSKTVALPYFWEKFDSENYSVWSCEYKFPEQLKLVFMSCNLVTGMFQRLDRMRKHAFGSMIVFGTDNDNTISGIWFWRGHDLAFTLSEDLQIDYESYSWKKLDPGSEETKKLAAEYFSWEGEFGGKKLNQGKIFK